MQLPRGTNHKTLEQMMDLQFRRVFNTSMEKLHAARTKHHEIAIRLERVKREPEKKERRDGRAH